MGERKIITAFQLAEVGQEEVESGRPSLRTGRALEPALDALDQFGAGLVDALPQDLQGELPGWLAFVPLVVFRISDGATKPNTPALRSRQ